MVAALGKAQILLPPVQYAEVGYFILDDTLAAVRDNLIGAWFFNQYSGESDEDAAFRCSQNWAPGANNQSADRSWVNGIPTTIEADYFRFANSTPLITRLTLPASSTMVAIARTLDSNIDPTNGRGFICGTFGNTLNDGDCIEFSVWTTGQFRVLGSRLSDSAAQSSTAQTGTNNLDKWRMWAGRVSTTELKAENLNPADGSTPVSTPLTLTGGHLAGTQTFTIGGRVTSGVNYGDTIHKDIACVLLFDTDLTDGQLNSVQAQLERTMAMTSLTFGSV